MNDKSTQELLDIINEEAFAALRGDERDRGAADAILEIEKREADAEYVRLSNKKKNSWGSYYICGKMIDGVITSRFQVSDEAKAKSYRKAF